MVDVWELKQEVRLTGLSGTELDAEYKKSRLLLECYSPYTIDGVYLVRYTYDRGYDGVIVSYIDDLEGVVDEYRINLDEFIEEHRPYIEYMKPYKNDLVNNWVSYNGDI